MTHLAPLNGELGRLDCDCTVRAGDARNPSFCRIWSVVRTPFQDVRSDRKDCTCRFLVFPVLCCDTLVCMSLKRRFSGLV